VPIGPVTYQPSPSIAFPRSYVAALRIWMGGNHVVTWNGNEARMDIVGPPAHYYIFRFSDFFIPWSSNAYTLDHILTDAFYVIPPSPTQNPAPVTVSLLHMLNDHFWLIAVGPFGTSSSPDDHDLEGSPAGWWSG